MPQFVIDGKSYEYNEGQKLLQFCQETGIEVPFFCYHEAMSVPTNCRMCLVEVGFPAINRETSQPERDENGEIKVNWGRKPVTSCNQGISPGMHVKTQHTSSVSKTAQEGVLEYMLVNHPLDCPICDQAGECPLQIWTYKYGPEGSRFEGEKVHKPKRIVLGPNVILDAERCINCTRCTRFTEEISKTDQLTIQNRGDKNYPTTAPGESFTDAYSMNVIDLCPVGALTSDDFRFKARVWEMAFTPNICTGCSNGCNADVWVRDNEVLRQTPRENKAVNQFWMCDEGRLDIAKFGKNRVSGGYLKGNVPAELETAVIRAGNLVKDFPNQSKIMFIGSAYASFETNFALRKFASKTGVKNVVYVPHIEKGWGDDFLKKDDRTPNAAACDLLGFEKTSVEDIRHKIQTGEVKFIYLCEDDSVITGIADLLNQVTLIAQSYNLVDGSEKAEVILPAATHLESEGVYVNVKGIPQVSRMVKEIKRMTPEMWMRLPKSRTDKAAVAVDNWRHNENIFDVLPGWNLVEMVSRQAGIVVDYGSDAQTLLANMKSEYEILRNVKYDRKVPKEAFKMSQFEFAVK